MLPLARERSIWQSVAARARRWESTAGSTPDLHISPPIADGDPEALAGALANSWILACGMTSCEGTVSAARGPRLD